jgi:hypothetical protein
MVTTLFRKSEETSRLFDQASLIYRSEDQENEIDAFQVEDGNQEVNKELFIQNFGPLIVNPLNLDLFCKNRVSLNKLKYKII